MSASITPLSNQITVLPLRSCVFHSCDLTRIVRVDPLFELRGILKGFQPTAELQVAMLGGSELELVDLGARKLNRKK